MRLAIACLLVGLVLVPAGAAHAAAAAGGAAAAAPARGDWGSDSQIDETAPDEAAPGAGAAAPAGDLASRVRAFVSASLSKYDETKGAAAGFRRQGWFPSFFLRDPEADVAVETAPGGAKTVTVHLSCARRDIAQRVIVGPLERLSLPGADRRFFTELLAAVATLTPEVAHARLRLWFASLRADGGLTWEARGGLGLAASVARRFPPGARTAEALWPLLEENTVPATAWPQ